MCCGINIDICDTYEIQGSFRDFTVLSYIGQCDLHNTCFGLPQVWYTPVG